MNIKQMPEMCACQLHTILISTVIKQMHVLHVLSFVIERVGSKIRPYTASLVQYLPLLWKESEEHNMLRCAILTSLIHLVQVRAMLP